MLVGDHIYFDFAISDVDSYPLERLLNIFGKLNVRILIYVNTDSGQYEHPAFPALGSVLF